MTKSKKVCRKIDIGIRYQADIDKAFAIYHGEGWRGFYTDIIAFGKFGDIESLGLGQ